MPESGSVDLDRVAIARGARAVGARAPRDDAVVRVGVDERVREAEAGGPGQVGGRPGERDLRRAGFPRGRDRDLFAEREDAVTGGVDDVRARSEVVLRPDDLHDDVRLRKPFLGEIDGHRGSAVGVVEIARTRLRRGVAAEEKHRIDGVPVGHRDFDDEVGSGGRRPLDGDAQVRQRLVRHRDRGGPDGGQLPVGERTARVRVEVDGHQLSDAAVGRGEFDGEVDLADEELPEHSVVGQVEGPVPAVGIVDSGVQVGAGDPVEVRR